MYTIHTTHRRSIRVGGVKWDMSEVGGRLEVTESNGGGIRPSAAILLAVTRMAIWGRFREGDIDSIQKDKEMTAAYMRAHGLEESEVSKSPKMIM